MGKRRQEKVSGTINVAAGCCPAAPRAEECLQYRDVEAGPYAIASPSSHARDDQCKSRGRLIPGADLMSEIVPGTFCALTPFAQKPA